MSFHFCITTLCWHTKDNHSKGWFQRIESCTNRLETNCQYCEQYITCYKVDETTFGMLPICKYCNHIFTCLFLEKEKYIAK